jgi:sugar (pentulose or hexulose) kinase
MLLPAEQDAAYGAALITGIAAGLIDSAPAALQDLIQLKARLEPDPQTQAVYAELFAIYRDADQLLVDVAHRLADFEQRFTP